MLGFEAVSVLESDDGLSYQRERPVQPTDAAYTPATAQPALSLRDQLALNQEKCEAEILEKKNLYKLSLTLSADDSDFIANERRKEATAKQLLKERELAEFNERRDKLKSKHTNIGTNVSTARPSSSLHGGARVSVPVAVVAVKRKHDKRETAIHSQPASPSQSAEKRQRADAVDEVASASVAVPNAVTSIIRSRQPATIAPLIDYGGDSDSDNDHD